MAKKQYCQVIKTRGRVQAVRLKGMQRLEGGGRGKVKSQFKLYKLGDLFFVTLLPSITDILLTPPSCHIIYSAYKYYYYKLSFKFKNVKEQF